MNKRIPTLLILLLTLSMVLGACSSPTEDVVMETPGADSGIPNTGAESTPGEANRADPGSVWPGLTTPTGPGLAGPTDTTQDGSTAPVPPASTETAPSGSLSDLVGPVVDWTGPWMNFFANAPDDFYIVKLDALSNELASAAPPFLLDVRDADEIARDGFIKGAVNMPFNTVLGNLDKLPAMDQPIVVYSSLGHRGAMTLASLRLLGYSNVRLMEGGISSWLQAGLPVESGVPSQPVAGAAPAIDPALLTNLESFILGTEPTAFYGIEATSLQAQLSTEPKPFLLDVRNPDEAAATGSIEGSVFIPLKTLLENLGQLPADKDAPIVTVSSNGHRATIAMMALHMIGYSNVTSLFGGINSWIAAGLPVVQ